MAADDKFDWDDKKAAANQRKHGVAFEEAQSVYGDKRAVTIYDREHSDQEDRFITIGLSEPGRLLVVVHTDRGELMWIISARKATKREARKYAKENR